MSNSTAPADVAPTHEDEPALLDWLHTMREQHPVWQDRYGVWHVFRHADVQASPATPRRSPRTPPGSFPAKRSSDAAC